MQQPMFATKHPYRFTALLVAAIAVAFLAAGTADIRPFALVTALVWALAVVVVATGALARGAARVGNGLSREA